jgi:prepilin-type N-terminal cleavage/methylation domain-containing protein
MRMNRDRSAERGFTLVEIIVVLVIVAILMAIILPSFGGAKHTSDHQMLVTAAQDYADAVESFRLDHDGLVPQTSADWPADAARAVLGPVDSITGKPYMHRGAPTGVTDPNSISVTVQLRTGTVTTPAVKQGLNIQYRPVYKPGVADPTEFQIVATDTTTHTERSCTITNAGAGTC